MRLRRVSPHIWQVRLRRLTSVNVWLVEADEGLTIVDTGYGFMARDVLHAVRLVDVGPVRRVLLTHGHPDHAGGAPLIAAKLRVPVFAHQLELPFLTGARHYPRIPTFLYPHDASLARALPAAADGTPLRLGGLAPWLTPGHTPGHVVYYHEVDDVLLAGDLFKAHRGHLRHLQHWYSLDKQEAVRSEKVLGRIRPGSVEASHGGSVPNPPLAL